VRPIYWKLALTVTAGTIAGLFGGQATIAGLVQPTRPATIGRALAPPDQLPEIADAGYARIADACDDCSDYDLGYRFAAARQVRQSAECMDFSWSYQRGCLAWLRQG
jgi:hypothetical protein